MAAKNIRILVVDDSALIREMLCDIIQEAPGMEVAATAADGLEALDRIAKTRPDVVTLDIQMPRMNGLDTLDAILRRDPIPVIMVSSVAQRDAHITMESLDRGALDYIAKPVQLASVGDSFRQDILRKIRTIANADVRRILRIREDRSSKRGKVQETNRRPIEQIDPSNRPTSGWCVAIGISTGGPPALSRLFESLAPPMPPIVVVQHMPEQFTGPFANRLDANSQLTIKEAEHGDLLKPNHVLIARGGRHLQLKQQGSLVKVFVRDGEVVSGHKPSVDVMMSSAAPIYRQCCLGVVMTGMGRDGADGCGQIRAQGGYVLGQDQASSDVYGMNKAAFVEGHVDKQFALENGAAVITAQLNRMSQARASAAR
jgi:two-component system, chemotaxis family, protein-glutamate methylesterase/glutaminase